MACGSGCCAAPTPETGTGQSSEVPQLPTNSGIAQQETLLDQAEDDCCAREPAGMTAATTSCADACCAAEGPSVSASETKADDKSCQDGCCPPEESDDDCGDTCCGSKQAEPGAKGVTEPSPSQDMCCASEAAAVIQQDGPKPACADGCCSDEPPVKAQPVPIQSSCEDACCSEESPASEGSSTPDCCVDKPSPCCDNSCLDRLAVRECQNGSTVCSGK